MRLRSFLLILTISCATTVVRADDASKLAKVHEFFKVAKLDELTTQLVNQTMQQVDSGMMQQMFGVKLTPEQQTRANDFTAKVMKVCINAFGWQAVEPEYAKIYADAYTEQQMDDILAFYKSPTGQAVVEKSPILVKQSGAIVQQRMKDVMPQIQQLVKDFLAQEKAASEAKPKE